MMSVHSSKGLLVESSEAPSCILADSMIQLALDKGKQHEVSGRSIPNIFLLFFFFSCYLSLAICLSLIITLFLFLPLSLAISLSLSPSLFCYLSLSCYLFLFPLSPLSLLALPLSLSTSMSLAMDSLYLPGQRRYDNVLSDTRLVGAHCGNREQTSRRSFTRSLRLLW